MRGAFIVIEGCDRSGKTTLCTRLRSWMPSNTVFMRFPDRDSVTGKALNEYLKMEATLSDECAHLLFQANRWEKAHLISEYLEGGRHIVCDRYSYSGMAVAGAKAKLDLAWARHGDTGLPKPDMVILLDVDPDIAAGRAGYGGERFENKTLQAGIRASYLDMAEPAWQVMYTSTLSEDQVFEKATKVLTRLLATPITDAILRM